MIKVMGIEMVITYVTPSFFLIFTTDVHYQLMVGENYWIIIREIFDKFIVLILDISFSDKQLPINPVW